MKRTIAALATAAGIGIAATVAAPAAQASWLQVCDLRIVTVSDVYGNVWYEWHRYCNWYWSGPTDLVSDV